MKWSPERVPMSLDDKSFSISEAWTLVNLLSEYGVRADALLQDSSIESEMLHDPQARISFRQQLRVHENARRLSTVAALGVLAGERLHLTAYGIFGFAMLSSPNLDQALQVARKCSPLFNMKFEVNHKTIGNEAVIEFHDVFDLAATDRDFCLELELVKTVTLLRDLLGDALKLTNVQIDLSSQPLAEWCQNRCGCKVWSNSGANELHFPVALLTRPLAQAHPITHRYCMEVCDHAMGNLAQVRELSHHVRRMLFDAEGSHTLAEIADQLCMTPRTLRRKLHGLNTSYQAIVEDVRKTLAIRYLSTTVFTTEVIAERLGYSDAANFRHAFKRWTGRSPKEYRLRNGIHGTGHLPWNGCSSTPWGLTDSGSSQIPKLFRASMSPCRT
jgi:AraC-like DNA-binding protein